MSEGYPSALDPVMNAGDFGSTSATWPSGSPDWIDYDDHGFDGETQILCDAGHARSTWSGLLKGYDFDGLDERNAIFTAPGVYNHGLVDISGADLHSNELDDGEIGLVVEDGDDYVLEKATSKDDVYEDGVVAFGYADAFGDQLPVINVENARDTTMAFFHNDEYTGRLDELQSEAMDKFDQMREVKLETLKSSIGWSEPDMRTVVEDKAGIHQYIAERYEEEEGEEPSRDPHRLIKGSELEEMSERGDEIGEMAETLLGFEEWKEEARQTQYRQSGSPEHFQEYWEETVLPTTEELARIAEENGEPFIAVHDFHDLGSKHGTFYGDSAPFIDPEEVYGLLLNSAEDRFENVEMVDAGEENRRPILYVSNDQLELDSEPIETELPDIA